MSDQSSIRGITPARLQSFLAIVEEGSARAAARRLSVTESAVSAALAALHRDLGTVLFERDGRGLRLTESGAIYAGYARRVLGLIEEGMNAARQGLSAESGVLRLGAVATVGEYLLPSLLASFRVRFPDVELTLEVGVRDRVFAALADHRLDIVIGGRPIRGRGLVTRATRPNSLIVVAARQMTATELATTPWLLREPGSGTRETTLALLHTMQITPPLLALGSHGAVVASAVLGLGVTVVSADAVDAHLQAGTLRRLDTRGTPLDRPWHAVTSAAPTATARLFLDHLTDGGAHAAGALAFTPRPARAGDARAKRRF
ncbi:MAG TPA: LysR substrate-binding domain-containing protein [Jatrophihabitantaceae bacterium]|jgi:DNA-binding transcriptional LysR family regulator